MNPEDVKFIVIHCADTPAKMDIGAAEIDRWHRKNGWNGIGYHYVIRRDGSLEHGRKVTQPGAHVYGHNRESLGICLVGGRSDEGLTSENNFTPEQFGCLAGLVLELGLAFPAAQVVGHRDLDKRKACPSFDVKAWAHDVKAWAQESLGEPEAPPSV